MKGVFRVLGIFLLLFLTFCSKGGPRNDYEHFIQGKTEVDKNTLKLAVEYMCNTAKDNREELVYDYLQEGIVWGVNGFVVENTADCLSAGQIYSVTIGNTTQIPTEGNTTFGIFTHRGKQVDKVSVVTARTMSFPLNEKNLEDGVKYRVAMAFKSATGAELYARLAPITLYFGYQH